MNEGCSKTKGTGFSSIKTMLIFIMTLACLVPLVVTVLVSFFNMRGVAENEAESSNSMLAKYTESDVVSTMTANFQVLLQIADSKSTRDFVKDPDNEELYEAMVEQLQSADANFDDGNSTVITGPDGQNLARSKGDFTNIADREYFRQAMSGVVYLSEVSVSKTTGAKIIVPAVPIFDDDGTTVLGVVTRNFNVGYLNDLLKEITGAGQHAYVFNLSDGALVATGDDIPEDAEISAVGSASYDRAIAGDMEGSYIENFNGDKRFTSFVSEPLTGWLIVCAGEYDVAMAETRSSVIIMVIVGFILAVIAVVTAIIVGKSINGPLQAIDDSIEQLADGKFKKIDAYTGRKDEFGAIIRNTNSALDRLGNIVGSIKSAAGKVANSANELANSSNQISKTADDVSEAVQGVARGASQQADEVQTANDNTVRMSDNIQNVTENSDSLTVTADAINSDSQNAAAELEKLKVSSDEMSRAVDDISERISATGAAVENISGKVEAINSIANQTNLLALNASIEAARAGEAGRSFAVVAEEISKLADNSAQSADEIRQQMEILLVESQSAVSTAKEVREATEGQREILEATIESINSMISRIDSTVTGVKSINEDARACDSSKNVIVEAMHSLSAISEENAATCEETSASMQELNATVNILAGAADSLRDISDDLNNEMSFFQE